MPDPTRHVIASSLCFDFGFVVSHDQHEQATRDYGFSEQLHTRTTRELREFYVQLLKKAEPLAIHRARRKGKLVQFADGHVDITTPRMKDVLQGLQYLEMLEKHCITKMHKTPGFTASCPYRFPYETSMVLPYFALSAHYVKEGPRVSVIVFRPLSTGRGMVELRRGRNEFRRS